jgi:hypothetical protein
MMSSRKASDDIARKERVHEMMAKLKRSQKQVEAYMQEQAHKNMLHHEQKKLYTQDMKK